MCIIENAFAIIAEAMSAYAHNAIATLQEMAVMHVYCLASK
jgi:hypothetical protein